MARRCFEAALGVALIAALIAAFGTVTFRPLDVVEGEILFEAQRLRQHLVLYVDPMIGAHDYGPVPARYYVLYTPLWPWILSLLPGSSVELVARLAGGLAWFGLLAAIVVRTPRARRKAAAIAAAWAGATFMLGRTSASATADAVAVLLAGIALLCSARQKRVEPVAALLFVLAAWLKPNVIGLGAGAFLHELLARRWRSLPVVGIAVGSCLALAWLSSRLSGGLWWTHMSRSTIQSVIPMRGVMQVLPRLPFLGLPHLLVGAAAWSGERRRSPEARQLLTVLAVSLAWTVVSMSKVGSSTNYWLEPTVAAVVLAAEVPLALPVQPWAQNALLIAGSVVLALDVRGSWFEVVDAAARRDALAQVRKVCGAGPADVVLAEHPGLEMRLDGRVVDTPFQMTHLVRAGRYPERLWATDIALPQVRCLVTESDVVERPLGDVDLENDRYPVDIRALLKQRFSLVREQAGLWIYRSREPAL